MKKAIVSEKGQVTIPKSLRDRLGIGPGQTLEFEAERGRLVARKAESTDPIDAAFGAFRADESTDALLERLRGRVDPA